MLSTLNLRALAWALLASALLAASVVAGSRNLQNFDGALAAYLFATLFAAFGIVYRYAVWLQRPPTRLYSVGRVASTSSPAASPPTSRAPPPPRRRARAPALHLEAKPEEGPRARPPRVGVPLGLRDHDPARLRLGPLHAQGRDDRRLRGAPRRLPRLRLPARRLRRAEPLPRPELVVGPRPPRRLGFLRRRSPTPGNLDADLRDGRCRSSSSS